MPVRTFISLFTAIFLTTSLSAQQAAPVVDAEIPGEISDGKASAPPLPPVLPDFEVKSTVLREVEVIEPPPMCGLPPVEGTITITAHLVEDPKLPDPPPPAPPLDSRFRKPHIGARQPETRFISVSATVYDHSRTLLRCRLNGGLSKEVTAWSNLDFNHFNGFSNFEVKESNGAIRRYQMHTGVGVVLTLKRAALLAARGIPYEAPVIPALPDGVPAYVITDPAPDADAAQAISDLHELYRNEGARMAKAYTDRIKAEEAKRTWLTAHPPVPKDVTVSFWEREYPVGMSADTIKKGGGD